MYNVIPVGCQKDEFAVALRQFWLVFRARPGNHYVLSADGDWQYGDIQN